MFPFSKAGLQERKDVVCETTSAHSSRYNNVATTHDMLSSIYCHLPGTAVLLTHVK